MVVVWLSTRLPGGCSVAVIAAYLTFFPVDDQHAARAALRRPARARADALLRGGRRDELWKLRVPAALPYLFTALKISAPASVVGAIIGELPVSIQDGLGGAILNFNQYYLTRRRASGRRTSSPRCSGSCSSSSSLMRRAPRRPPGPGARRVTEHDGPTWSDPRRRRKVFAGGRRHGAQAIDLDVRPGEFVSLIGPSGCGKSTLLRIDRRPGQPTAGEVLVERKDRARGPVDGDYGIVFQDAVLYDWRTVAKNIALPLELVGWDQRQRTTASTRCSQLVELKGFEDHHPWQLSGGMQQRVVDRARALVLAGAAADGRAVRRPRRDDPGTAEHGAPADLGGERAHGRLRHALDRRGGLPVDAGGRDVASAGADRRGRRRSTCRSPRTGDTREEPRFFELVTAVREPAAPLRPAEATTSSA